MHEFWMPGDNCDLRYRYIRDLDTAPCKEIRQQLEAYWDQCSSYTDSNFREEFSRQPDQRFWEIYLIFRLLKAGKPVVERQHRTQAGPDILVDEGDRKVWIEAVTFERGDRKNPDRVPKMKPRELGDREPLVVQNVPVNNVELRISSVFDKKSRKFRKYTENGITEENDVTLIAINPGIISMQANDKGRGSPFCVLYPLGDEYVTFHSNTDETSSGFHLRYEIERTSSDPISIGMFADVQHNHISGVIWSKTTLGNFTQGRNDDLILYPNAMSTYPLSAGWLDWGTEWGTAVDDDGLITLAKLS